MRREAVRSTEGSGNIFADIGLSDAPILLLKAELARQIGIAIKNRALTQIEAAELMGVDQPKISAILRGRLDAFSVDRLVRMLLAMGIEVDLQVKARRRNGNGKVPRARAAVSGR